ncbi:hypothetical protein A3K93_09130 [Acinetobacter sp. NCu2D-2]|uniref:hypothetical protein n=1 Tax=Acinetobacter sp. NCu2D-2 TaxID=1608473 RepID=UPI0007CDD9FB|nr:hypothetical protein [Acinetobacter sp. NCu2D-2]ANF82336.1 hypothetical protein A3K93_09130 [Acinetobacter sp. NCu2D-2]
MLKRLFLSSLFGLSLGSQAALVNLSNDQLTQAIGQGGADLNWTLSLNHEYATNMEINEISTGIGNDFEVYYKLDETACGLKKVLCRLAIAPNNHLDENGNKKWLVFKGVQGTVQIDKFSLDGTTITRMINNNNTRQQTALKISFEDKYPFKIRNLGFETLAVENAKEILPGDSEVSTTGKTYTEGYLNTDIYKTNEEITDYDVQTDSIPKNWFDSGAEKGFMGINVHGNLHINGNIKIFSYNCDGTGRC